jgi:outer membrane protein OmpA-like peptidoglycan-associated protein/uncharacterized protein YegP (UPF0339 family)
MRFSMFTTGTANTQFAFSLLSNDNQILLRSTDFPNRDACVAAMRTVIQNLPSPNAYTTTRQGNGFVLNIRNTEGGVLASSPIYDAETAGLKLNALQKDASDEQQYPVDFTTTTTQTAALPSLTAIDFASLYDFGMTSPSRHLGFHPYQKEADKMHYFCYYDNGEALLYGRGYDSGSKRDKRIRQVIEASPKAQRWEIVANGGQYYFILKEKNGLEIARSRSFASREAAQGKINLLIERLPTFAEQFAEVEKLKKVNQYDFTLTTDEATGFNSLRGADKGHYFIVNDSHKKPILFSQNYSSSMGRNNGMKTTIKSLSLEKSIEYKEKKGKFYFIVKATNKQEVAHSAFFDSKEDREQAIKWMKNSNLAWASKYGVDMSKKETVRKQTVSQTEHFTLDVERAPSAATPLAAAATVTAAAILSDNTVEKPAQADATPKAVETKPVIEEKPKVEIKQPAKPIVENKPKVVADNTPKTEKVTVETTPKAQKIASTTRTHTEKPTLVAPESGSFPWKWLLLGLLALGLLFLLLKGCPTEKANNVAVVEPLPVEKPKPIVSDETTEPKTLPSPMPVTAPTECNLTWILFDFNKADITLEAREELTKMAKILKENKDYTAILHAHTDAIGSVAYNKALSERRATNAKGLLKKLGISTDKIKTTASGKNNPFAKNTDDDTGRKFNRRVELSIQDKEGKEVCNSIPPSVSKELKME